LTWAGLIEWAAHRFCTYRPIVDRLDKSIIYLERWYVFGDAESRWFLAIHKINKSDADRHLHDHSWHWFVLHLAGMYREHLPSGPVARRPGSLRARSKYALHRLELPPSRPVFSLFFGGPRSRTWGFRIDRSTWLPHKVYLK
jgi:hypothetical protein